MEIEIKLKNLRVQLRHNSKNIVDGVLNRNVSKSEGNFELKEICSFCATTSNLTKEHVIPRWVFENCSKKYFKTNINGVEQTYNKTTIPACANCNNDVLANIENHIKSILCNIDLAESFYSLEQIQNIIRWLEIIEYKFQLLEFRRTFKKAKSSEFVAFLKDIPLAVMREEIEFSPAAAIAQLRNIQKKITVRSKIKNINSLVIFNTKNKNFHFFHNINDFIFIELPKFQVALFYFYSRTFEDNEQAKDEATKLIKRFYN
jgi:hypothetical protein